MAPKFPFYAVAKGKHEGIFTTWEETKSQVNGFPNSKYKGFASRLNAEKFLRENGASAAIENVKEEEENREDLLQFSELSLEDNAPAAGSPSDPITIERFGRTETKSAAKGNPDPRDPGTLVAFCNGSALDNGDADCRGGYACVSPHCKDWKVTKEIEDGKRATNERADCYAVLEAMKCANVKDPKQDQTLFIFTNHLNVIKAMTKWISKWRTNGWLTTKKEPVENRDLFEKLWEAQGKRHIVWTHVVEGKKISAWEEEWSTKAVQAARSAASGNL